VSALDVARFGGIDADADELLKNCFQDHPAYLSALNHARFVIVGCKGSGKTAIYKKLITERLAALDTGTHLTTTPGNTTIFKPKRVSPRSDGISTVGSTSF
jgi:hypothetical protein